MSTAGDGGGRIPTVLTATSRPPYSFATRSKTASTSDCSRTSAMRGRCRGSPPDTSSNASRFRPMRATAAPESIRSAAIARPIPLLAPTTTARRSFVDIVILSFILCEIRSFDPPRGRGEAEGDHADKGACPYGCAKTESRAEDDAAEPGPDRVAHVECRDVDRSGQRRCVAREREHPAVERRRDRERSGTQHEHSDHGADRSEEH